MPVRQATTCVLSPTAQFGMNVFEGIRCYWDKNQRHLLAFRLRDHLNRLMESARLIQIAIPYTAEEIEGFIRAILEANSFADDVAIRLTAFVDGVGSWHTSDPVSMFIAPSAKNRTDINNIPMKHACVSSWQRINDNALPPRAKVGANYINGRYAHLNARANGYDLPILLGADGKVAEGAGACIFIVRKGHLITPPVTSSSLDSITRDTLIKIATSQGITVEERVIDRTELYLSEEAFFCGTAAEISPVASVDKLRIGSGTVGEVTMNLFEAYLQAVSGMTGDASRWCTAMITK